MDTDTEIETEICMDRERDRERERILGNLIHVIIEAEKSTMEHL
jgi:hypothetical protein